MSDFSRLKYRLESATMTLFLGFSLWGAMMFRTGMEDGNYFALLTAGMAAASFLGVNLFLYNYKVEE